MREGWAVDVVIKRVLDTTPCPSWLPIGLDPAQSSLHHYRLY